MHKPVTVLLAVLFLPIFARAGGANEALWSAARRGDSKVVETVLVQGADVNARTSYGATALWFACFKGQTEVVKVLLKHHADLNVRDETWRASPLDMAVGEGYVPIVTLLLQAGARGADDALLDAASKGNGALLKVVLEHGNLPEETKSQALLVASEKTPEIAALLKKAGARPLADGGSPNQAALVPYLGTYENANGSKLTISCKSGVLLGQSFGSVSVLKPSSEDSFKAVGSEGARFTFKCQGGRVVSLTRQSGEEELLFDRVEARTESPSKAVRDAGPVKVVYPRNWPSFRGDHAEGVADGQHPPAAWDAVSGRNIRWKTPIPGLAHSSPIIWGKHVFVSTAVSGAKISEFKPGLYGAGTSAADVSPHTWHVYCLDLADGHIIWDRVACQGVPKVKRHIKSSHANPTPATDGKHLVVSFASEGLYCYDLDGNLRWKQDLGNIDAGAFNLPEMQWGAASSPIIYRDLVIVQCDRQKDSYIAAFDVQSGKQVWRVPRDEYPSWGTPTVCETKGPGALAGIVPTSAAVDTAHAELVTNGTKFIRAYDPRTGHELWRLGPNSHITTPTPIMAHGLIFVTSGYHPLQPIYAVRPGGQGDISVASGTESNSYVAWSKKRGGPYMPTPLVYGPHLYTCSNNGLLNCYDARTGASVYRERLGGSDGYSASPVAADGKIYFTSESGEVRVVKAGPNFELLAVNKMGEPCMATPAISDGMFVVRSQHYVYGIGRH